MQNNSKRKQERRFNDAARNDPVSIRLRRRRDFIKSATPTPVDVQNSALSRGIIRKSKRANRAAKLVARTANLANRAAESQKTIAVKSRGGK
jgi:hypothetical protein